MSVARRGSPVITLVITCIGMFLVLLDASSISVALPTIQINLHTSLPDLQWVIDAYTLPFAVLLLTANALGERFGRKRLFLGGLLLFLLGSLLCGFAPTFNWLLAGRLVQGMGAAALASGCFSLLLAAFPDPRARTRAIAMWGAGSGLALPVGTLMSGIFIQIFNWPAIFFVNLPIGLLALALAWPLLAESRPPTSQRIDLAGLLLLTGWLTCLIVAMIASSSQGWTSPLILGLLVSSVLLLIVFLVVEARVREPMFPVRLFGNRVFSVAQIGGLMHGFAAIGTIFFFTQYFQEIQGYTVLQASLCTLPISAGAFLISPFAARLAAARLGPRLPIVLGALFSAVSLLLLVRLSPDSSYALLWWQMGLLGFGVGCMLGPLNMAMLSATPPTQTGIGASMMNTSRQVGAALGVAVLGAFVTQQFSQNIVSQFTQRGVSSAAIAEKLANSGALANHLHLVGQLALPQTALDQAFVDALHGAFLIAGIGLLIIAVLVAFSLYQKQRQTSSNVEVAETQEKAMASVI